MHLSVASICYYSATASRSDQRLGDKLYVSPWLLCDGVVNSVGEH
jgi:hypothetical protein